MMGDVQFELELTELAEDNANDSDDDIIEVDEVSDETNAIFIQNVNLC